MYRGPVPDLHGNANRDLARRSALPGRAGQAEVSSGREIFARYGDVREKDVFIVQPTAPEQIDHELLIMIERSSAPAGGHGGRAVRRLRPVDKKDSRGADHGPSSRMTESRRGRV